MVLIYGWLSVNQSSCIEMLRCIDKLINQLFILLPRFRVAY